MASTQLRPNATWQDLGKGPFDVQVLTGSVVLQETDRCPDRSDLSGTIVAATVGSAPTHLAASEWWIKALVAETVVTVITPSPAGAAAPVAQPAADAAVTSINGIAGPAVTIGAHDVGTLTTAEIEALVASRAHRHHRPRLRIGAQRMAPPIIQSAVQILRRLAGVATGAPSTLLAGQFFHNEGENILYIGIGAGPLNANNQITSTAQLKIAGVGAFLDLASAQLVVGKKNFSGGLTVPNGAAASDAAAFGQIAAALQGYAALAGSAFTGNVTVPTAAAGNNSALVANTAFVQQALSSLMQGWQTKPTAAGATTAALPAYTYANGQSGAGATLTGNANGALGAIDTGYTPAAGDLLLVKNETGSNAPVNGLYVVTATGSGSTPFVLTRSATMNAAGEFSGALVPVGGAGQANANSIWLCNPGGAVTVGTTAIPFTELNSATQLLTPATGGLTMSGNSLSINGFSGVAAGSLFKMNSAGTGLVAAVAGTDYQAPYSGIDSGTA